MEIKRPGLAVSAAVNLRNLIGMPFMTSGFRTGLGELQERNLIKIELKRAMYGGR